MEHVEPNQPWVDAMQTQEPWSKILHKQHLYLLVAHVQIAQSIQFTYFFNQLKPIRETAMHGHWQ